MAKLLITGEDIRKMNDKEWLEYRKKSWIRKREYYAKEMPEYYLPNKDSYAKYLDALSERIKKRESK